MKRSKSETQTARLALQGDEAAWTEIVTTHWQRIETLHRLATGDAEASRSLAAATFQSARGGLEAFLRDEETFAEWLAAMARDTARRHLSDDDWRATPWSHGQEILSDAPRVAPLASGLIHSPDPIPPGPVGEALAGLSTGHQLATHLLFQDQLSVGRLAGVLGASSMFVGSFAYGLLDQLGGLESIEHDSAGCRAGLLVALDALEARGDPQAVRDLLRTLAACGGCQTLVFRVLRLSESLGTSTADPAAPAPDLATLGLAGAPGSAVAQSAGEARPEPPPVRIIPLKSRPEPNHGRRLAHLAVAVALLLAFAGGTVGLLRGRPIGGSPGSAGEVPGGDADRTASAPGASGAVGYFAGLSGRKQVLAEGRALQSSPLGATELTLFEGPTALLSPASIVVARGAGLELERGRILLSLDGRPVKSGGFQARVAGLTVTAQKGTVVAATVPGEGTLVAVKGGSASVRLPDGTVLELDPFRQVRISPGGEHRVEDARPEAFGEAQLAAAGSGSSAAGPGGGLGRYAGRSGDGLGSVGLGTDTGSGTASGGARPAPTRPGGQPADNGIMTPGAAPSPGTVRGFRDAF